MITPHPSATAPWYIATVWMHDDGHANEPSTRQIVRLRATDPGDFRHAVALLWPRKALTFGPISEAKDQT